MPIMAAVFPHRMLEQWCNIPISRKSRPPISTNSVWRINEAAILWLADVFLIDRSNERVYIPDDGTFEFKGPSRAYGFETKASVQITRALSFNGGITKVGNVFYRGTLPRVYVDSAPRFTANAGLTSQTGGAGAAPFASAPSITTGWTVRIHPFKPRATQSGTSAYRVAFAEEWSSTSRSTTRWTAATTRRKIIFESRLPARIRCTASTQLRAIH